MRKANMMVLLFATMTMGLASCGKDDSGGDVGGGLPTFTTLYSYIGRTDIENIKSEFSSKGYDISMEGNDLLAEKEDFDFWEFEIDGGKVSGVSYSFEEHNGKTKELLISKLNEEKQFRSQSSLTNYSGGYLPNGGETDYFQSETYFQSKDELIAALQTLSLSSVNEGWSNSNYSDIVTSFTFGGDNGFDFRVKLI